jgi:hypothetical protein
MLSGFSNELHKAEKAMKLRGSMLAATALLGLAFALSTGDAFAGKPLFNTVKKGVNAIEDIGQGVAKGTRGALDDIGQGVARGADDLGEGAARGLDDAVEGAARGADDLLEGAAQGADDAAGAGRAFPPGADDAAGAPKYADAPSLDDADQVLKYDVVPEDTVGLANDLPDVPQNVPGYVVAPDAPNVVDDLAAAGDDLGAAGDDLAAPGNYIQPNEPFGIDPGAPPKPSKVTKKALPKLDNTKVAKVTPLGKAGAAADDGFGGLQRAAVKVLNMPVTDVAAEAAKKAAKLKAKKIRNIKIGVTTAVVGTVAVAAGTTAVLYYTVEPVKEGIDGIIGKTKDAVGDGLQQAADGLNGKTYTLTVTNVADGPVEIFTLDANGSQTSIGGIYQTPGSTTVSVKENDVVVVNLNDEEFTRIKVVEDKMQVDVQ